MVKRYYYKEFIDECIKKANGRDIFVWGGKRTGRALLNELLDNSFVENNKIHIMDKVKKGEMINGILVENPDEVLAKKNNIMIVCATENIKTAYKMAEIIFNYKVDIDYGAITSNYANFCCWMDDLVRSSPEFIEEERIELMNLSEVLYSHQNFKSDMIIDGEYKNSAVITTKIGCPIKCKYCPQDVFVKSYLKRKNPVMELSLMNFKKMLEKIPKDVIVSFTGFVEPFANPNCIDMIMYSLESGYKVRVFSTLYNVSIDDYKRFKDHKNLKTLDVHLPDSNYNTEFPITDEYKETLKFVFDNPPKYAELLTCCLGVTSRTREEIRDIISVSGDAIASIHGLVYDNKLTHGNAKLTCNRDCCRINNPKAGIAMIQPNGDAFVCGQDWELENFIGNIYLVDNWNDLIQGELRMKFRDSLSDPKIDNMCTYCELALEVDIGDKF